MALKYAQEQCDVIMDKVHSSKLHFMVQDTPFSLYLTVRKKFITKYHGVGILDDPKEEECYLSDQKQVQLDKGSEIIKVQQGELDKAKDIIASLESKLVKAEKDFFNLSSSHKLKSDEMRQENKLLKESINKSNEEVKEHKKFLGEANKLSESCKRLENLLDTNKTL